MSPIVSVEVWRVYEDGKGLVSPCRSWERQLRVLWEDGLVAIYDGDTHRDVWLFLARAASSFREQNPTAREGPWHATEGYQLPLEDRRRVKLGTAHVGGLWRP